MSGIIRVLGLHLRNIINALERHMITSNSCIPLWSLSIRKRKIDGCTIDVKNVTIAWWAFEIRVSPNNVDVMRKCLEVGVYDENPMHFLMEIQVMCINTLSFILINFIVLQCSLKVVEGFPTWEVVGKLTYLLCNCFHSSMTFVDYAKTIWCKLCKFVYYD
jgi:hypothetical protein